MRELLGMNLRVRELAAKKKRPALRIANVGREF